MKNIYYNGFFGAELYFAVVLLSDFCKCIYLIFEVQAEMFSQKELYCNIIHVYSCVVYILNCP